MSIDPMASFDQYEAEQNERALERAREREWHEAEGLMATWVREYFAGRAYPAEAPQWERDTDAASLILKQIALDPGASAFSDFLEGHGTPALLSVLGRALERVAKESEKPWTGDDELAASADLEHESLREA